MTEAPSKRELLREERRQQILEAALAVFAQKGFHAANVSDVAAQAGVSQGTIYWYFKSKDELLTAALFSLFEDFEQEAVAPLAQCATAVEKLRALGRSMVDFVASAQGILTLFLEYWASSAQRTEAGQSWVNLLVTYKGAIVAVIEQGIEDGEFKSVDAESMAWALMAAYDGLAVYTMLMPDLDLGRTSEAFVEALLSGLLAGS
jgi:AcrR family transcriptional regulator